MVDRTSIEKDKRDFYANSKLIGKREYNKFDLNLDDKEKFLLAMAFGFGLGVRTPIESKDGFVLLKYFTEEEMALLYAVAFSDSNNENILEDLDEVITIANEYANTGINVIMNTESKASSENLLLRFEKIIMNRLIEINNKSNEI